MHARITIASLALTSLFVGPVATAASSTSPTPEAASATSAGRTDATGVASRTVARTQTSDGQAGAVPVVPLALARATIARRAITRTQLAPGITYTHWSQTDARGPIRAYLVTVDYKRAGVSIDYRNAGKVAEVANVYDQAKKAKAIAAVNGDFYDIGKTGAPLGVGRARSGGTYNARVSGWNSAFYLGPHGRPEIGTIPLGAAVKQYPKLNITNLNSHFVAPGGIGIYNKRWGTAPGYDVTQGQKKNIRRVTIRDGRVVKKGTKLKPGRAIDDLLLIGRGEGAKALNTMKVGSKASVTWWLKGKPSMVVTGSRFLVEDGVVKVVDDKQMEPRTAIGIDRDTHEILLLVIDGRQKKSRGYTMVELANEMVDLGADEALNLDGGGSSTMVARNSDGALSVMNTPSDGFLRRVANTVVVKYKAP